MVTPPGRRFEVRGWCYHVLVLCVGLAIAGLALRDVIADREIDWQLGLALLLGVPLIAVVARFPMVLDSGWGSVEVGFDSSILMFLLCTLSPAAALVAWAAAVLATQLTSEKRWVAKVFNVGVGIVAGSLAAAVYRGMGGFSTVDTPRGLLAVALAAACYFVTDYVMSAFAVVVASRAPLRRQLLQRGTLLAIACFVPLDSLGYLGAVVVRSTPWWTVMLLAVPLATLLIATRAVTRGGENARRLAVLFGAAVRAQTLVDEQAVADALVRDAGQLLRLRDVQLRATPPAPGEIGVQTQLGGEDTRWLVARSLSRARSTVAADEQALGALAAVASDALGRLKLTDEMVHIARHDPLTDLPNRGILLDRVRDVLQTGDPTRVGLLFLDLDGFKPVNDRFGHEAGDAVLVQLATRLRLCVRSTDTVARLGGDEFAILVEHATPEETRVLCRRVLTAVEEGVELAGHRIRLGASLGVAYGARDTSAAGLLRNADLAMYEAKARGKGRYVEYVPAIGRARMERLEMVDNLRRAIGAGEIGVAYQPVVSVHTGGIVGVEALARWSRASGPIPPDVFIRAAEEAGLIIPLGACVLETVARDTPALQEAAGGGLSVAVNVSAAQLRDPNFVSVVSDAVAAMPGTTLILEITERQGVDLDDEVLAVMRTITELGVVFAIDDFGVGFSSISYLHDLPAGIIKADAALAATIDDDPRARALLRSVVLMGSTLGFEVVIEGIERESQLEVVREDAPDAMVQGYLLHRPGPLDATLELLRHRTRQAAGR